MQTIWGYYAAAAQKVRIVKEDIAKQLEAEYGVDMSTYLRPPPFAEFAKREGRSRAEQMKVLRKVAVSVETKMLLQWTIRANQCGYLKSMASSLSL